MPARHSTALQGAVGKEVSHTAPDATHCPPKINSTCESLNPETTSPAAAAARPLWSGYLPGSTVNTHSDVQLATQGDKTYSDSPSDTVSWCPGFSGEPCPGADPAAPGPAPVGASHGTHQWFTSSLPCQCLPQLLLAACSVPGMQHVAALPAAPRCRCAALGAALRRRRNHTGTHRCTTLHPPCPTCTSSRHCMSSDYEPSSSSSYGGDIHSSSSGRGECAATMTSLLPATAASLLPNMIWLPLWDTHVWHHHSSGAQRHRRQHTAQFWRPVAAPSATFHTPKP